MGLVLLEYKRKAGAQLPELYIPLVSLFPSTLLGILWSHTCISLILSAPLNPLSL